MFGKNVISQMVVNDGDLPIVQSKKKKHVVKKTQRGDILVLRTVFVGRGGFMPRDWKDINEHFMHV